jgi:hypothetical protein
LLLARLLRVQRSNLGVHGLHGDIEVSLTAPIPITTVEEVLLHHKNLQQMEITPHHHHLKRKKARQPPRRVMVSHLTCQKMVLLRDIHVDQAWAGEGTAVDAVAELMAMAVDHGDLGIITAGAFPLAALVVSLERSSMRTVKLKMKTSSLRPMSSTPRPPMSYTFLSQVPRRRMLDAAGIQRRVSSLCPALSIARVTRSFYKPWP